MENCKVQITWKILYETILKPYCPTMKRKSAEEIIAHMLPEDVFTYLFKQVTYNKSQVEDVYYGRDDAKHTFLSMRKLMINAKKNDGAYDINSRPILKAFQERWEECIPLLARLDEDDMQKDPTVRKLDDDIATLIYNVFREEPTDLEGHFLDLHENNMWSLELAKLSIIATSLSCFCTTSKKYAKANQEFQAVFLPFMEGPCKVPITWERLHNTILKPHCSNLAGKEIGDVIKGMFPENVFTYLFTFNPPLIECVYYGRDNAQEAYESMRKAMLDVKIDGGAYDINSFPILTDFQKRWEECIPLLVSSKADNGEEKNEVEILAQHIEELISEIPDEPTNIAGHLQELFDNKMWSLALAKLSIIATSRSCFCTKDDKYSKKNLRFQSIFLPLPEENEKPQQNAMGYDKLQASQIQLTWKKLHEEVFKKLNSDPRYQENKKFLEEILPGELFRKTCCTDEGGSNEKYVSCIYHGKNGAESRFKHAQTHIINLSSRTGEPYTWDTLPIIADFKAKWEELIPTTKYTALEANRSEDSNVREMQTVVDGLLNEIPADRQNVAVRIQGITKSEPYSMVLAILSVIASTLFCFGTGKEKSKIEDSILCDLVLPPLPEKETSSALQKYWKTLDDPSSTLEELEKAMKLILKDPTEMGEANFLLYQKAVKEGNTEKAETYLTASSNSGYLPAVRIFNENLATRMLDEAEKIFNLKIDVPGFDDKDKECCDKCEKILRMPTYIPKKCRADASYMLYKYIDGPKKYKPATGETAEYYLGISNTYGHKNAVDEWKSRNNSDIVPKPDRSVSQTNGICYCNADNQYAVAFEKTIPDSWGDTPSELDLSALGKDIFNPIHRRFLLLNDNFSQNLDDLFQILQLVKENNPQPEHLNWEFFVRHDSESIHSLVDTALSRLSEYKIPVYILNDSKIAAQQLLSQHPLFYPVRELKLDKIIQTGDYRPLLHFVVIGNSPVTEWLVREAFWMMGFRDNVIRSRITVLAKNGKDAEASIKGRFPGMSGKNTIIEGIDLPEIKGENVVLEFAELQRTIQEYTGETDYCYFAVATDCDEENLTLAIRVREFLIRTAIESQNEKNIDRMPPVAFLCRNQQIAWLSQCMVLEQGEYGNAWFNTRALIPFGEISHRYCFENINGGTFEKLAKCIHFQYSQLAPNAVHDATPEALAAEKDYYMRQYNQDSSFSMALGLPYRIFQFQDGNGIQITPTSWNILQKTPYASVDELHFMAKRMKNYEITEVDTKNPEITAIAQWEHARWVRFLLSRGWCTATIEESVFAKHSGNPRPQLFAAKMHPALCSYEAQNELGTRLNKDFYSYDYWNIEATKQLLDLEWVDKAKEITPKIEEIAR